MPNHVDQDLYVAGDPETIKAFQEFSKEMIERKTYSNGEVESVKTECLLLSAHNYIPYPEKYLQMDKEAEIERSKGNFSVKDGFNSGGYEWCCKNWGTKWGIYDCVLESEGESSPGVVVLKYNFMSAWSPVIPVIKAMSEKFPTLHFMLGYFEAGMGFSGMIEFRNGESSGEKHNNHYKGDRGG